MTIAWATLKTTVASDIADALATAQAQAIAEFPTPSVALSATYTWDGTNTVLTSDTSEVTTSPETFIKLDADGKWYKVLSIVTDTSVTVEDTYSIGSFPTGSAGSSKALGAVPSPPTSGSLNTKLATPIAVAVVDGIKSALDQAIINDVADDIGNSVGPGVIV